MKKHLLRMVMVTLSVASGLSSVSCYYPVRGRENASYNAYSQDSKGGYAAPREPMPQPGPRYVGVDPALAVAGVAAAGLLGYAIGNNRGHHHHHGPAYYRPVGYGYYGGYCR